LVTYRLPMRGEDWWKCFEDYMRGHASPSTTAGLLSLVKGFVRACSRWLTQQRIARLERVASSGRLVSLLEELKRDPLAYPRLAHKLWNLLSEALSQPSNAKTIVFSLKMGYYAYRAAGGQPGEISRLALPLPIDNRIACLTYSSRLCEVSSGDYRVIMSRPQHAQKAWQLISDISGVSTIHLDALAWRLGWLPRDSRSLEDARRRAYEILGKYSNGKLALKVSSELITRLCQYRRSRVA